jgi:hypothetical protein
VVKGIYQVERGFSEPMHHLSSRFALMASSSPDNLLTCPLIDY